MRVCIDISTGKVIEAQPGNDPRGLETLRQNAIAAGYDLNEVSVLIMEDAVAIELIESQIPAPVVQSISDRQFYQQLAVLGIISEAEALASNAAVIPAPLLVLIDGDTDHVGLPEGQRFAARMLLGGATVFERNHPMTIAIGAAYGWTGEQIDGFFAAAAQL